MEIPAIQWQGFISRLRRELALAQDHQKILALFLVEIRQFHLFNFQHGFNNGEAAAREALVRMKTCLKKEAIIARLGPDKLGLILLDVTLPELLPIVAQKVFAELSLPFAKGNDNMTLSPNLGVAFFPEHGSSAEELMAEAEHALQTALKTAAPYAMASGSSANKHMLSLQMEKDLQHAVVSDHLQLYYQPQIDLATLQPVGCEALMRWAIPNQGMISPDEFIPLAEASGSIVGLTEWALHTALREMSEIQPTRYPVSVSVNVSAASIYDPGLILAVESALAIWGIAPQRLTLEVTESSLMRNPQLCFGHLSRLQKLGVKIAIDDFGTGFSSLSYFKTIPADEIKIDQSFVKNMAVSTDDAKIIELIIDLSHKFALRVVAEGIESGEVFAKLRGLGCDYGQGYFVARPMDYPAYQQWLNNYEKKPLTI